MRLKALHHSISSAFLSRVLSPFSLPARSVSAHDGLLLIEFFIFLSPFRMDLTNPSLAIGRFLLLSTIPKLSTVWHSTLFHKLISAGLLSCFARWTQSFLSDRRACALFKHNKSCSFPVHQDVSQGSFLGLHISLFINNFPASLSSSVSFSLYADNLAIWSSYSSVPTEMGATHGSQIRLERWSED